MVCIGEKEHAKYDDHVTHQDQCRSFYKDYRCNRPNGHSGNHEYAKWSSKNEQMNSVYIWTDEDAYKMFLIAIENRINDLNRVLSGDYWGIRKALDKDIDEALDRFDWRNGD